MARSYQDICPTVIETAEADRLEQLVDRKLNEYGRRDTVIKMDNLLFTIKDPHSMKIGRIMREVEVRYKEAGWTDAKWQHFGTHWLDFQFVLIA